MRHGPDPAIPEPVGEIHVGVHRGRAVVAHQQNQRPLELASSPELLHAPAPPLRPPCAGLVAPKRPWGHPGGRIRPRRGIGRKRNGRGRQPPRPGSGPPRRRRADAIGRNARACPRASGAQPGRVAIRRKPACHRREEAETLRAPARTWSYLGSEIAVEEARLIAAVAPDSVPVPPPMPSVPPAIEPPDRGDVAAPGHASGEEREIGDAGGGGKGGNAAGTAAALDHRGRGWGRVPAASSASARSRRSPSTSRRKQRVMFVRMIYREIAEASRRSRLARAPLDGMAGAIQPSVPCE